MSYSCCCWSRLWEQASITTDCSQRCIKTRGIRDSFFSRPCGSCPNLPFIQVRALADIFHEVARNLGHTEPYSIQNIIMDTTNSLCGFWKQRAELEKTIPDRIPYGFPSLVDLAKHPVRESFQDPFPLMQHVSSDDLARSVLSRVATAFERMLLLLHETNCKAPAFLNCHKNIKVRDAKCCAHVFSQLKCLTFFRFSHCDGTRTDYVSLPDDDDSCSPLSHDEDGRPPPPTPPTASKKRPAPIGGQPRANRAEPCEPGRT